MVLVISHGEWEETINENRLISVALENNPDERKRFKNMNIKETSLLCYCFLPSRRLREVK